MTHTYIHTFISVKGNGENIINKTVMTLTDRTDRTAQDRTDRQTTV